MLSNETPPGKADIAAKKEPKWWCNFCNFKTDDQREYLAHSCTEVLKQQGKSVAATGKNECG
jgi:hypothetical protein